MGHVTMTTPRSEGVFCHSQAMIDRCIKFETSSSTHYEDRLGDVKI